MSRAEEEERISLVDADSMSPTAGSATIHPPHQHAVVDANDDGSQQDSSASDVKYSAQFLVAILQPVTNPNSQFTNAVEAPTVP